MSIRIMSAVWKSDAYEGSCLLLLLAMADYASDDGSGLFPSVGSLAKKIRACRRTVQYNLRALEDDGVIEVVREADRNRPREYGFTREIMRRWAVGRPEEPRDEGGARSAPRGVQDGHGRGAADCTPGVQRGAPKPSREPSKESLSIDSRFEAWWSLVPCEVSKGQARRAFRTALKRVPFETLERGIERYAEACRGKDPRFIAHPATWLDGERWDDEAPPSFTTAHEPEISPVTGLPAVKVRDIDPELAARLKATEAAFNRRRQAAWGDDVHRRSV